MNITDKDVYEALKDRGSVSEIRAWMQKRQQVDLRDKFAGQAMQTFVDKTMKYHIDHDGTGHMTGPSTSYIAETAYLVADAMLAERAK